MVRSRVKLTIEKKMEGENATNPGRCRAGE